MSDCLFKLTYQELQCDDFAILQNITCWCSSTVQIVLYCISWKVLNVDFSLRILDECDRKKIFTAIFLNLYLMLLVHVNQLSVPRKSFWCVYVRLILDVILLLLVKNIVMKTIARGVEQWRMWCDKGHSLFLCSVAYENCPKLYYLTILLNLLQYYQRLMFSSVALYRNLT